MRLMVDFSEPLIEWVTLLTDLQCDVEYVRSSVYYYDPGVDALFLDELIGSEDTAYLDDIVVYITNSARDLLRGRIDEFMSTMGFEVNRIVQVMTDSTAATVFALVDVTPLGMGECGETNYSDREHGAGERMAYAS